MNDVLDFINQQFQRYFTLAGRVSRASFLKILLVYSLALTFVLLYFFYEVQASGVLERATYGLLRGDASLLTQALTPQPHQYLLLFICFLGLLPAIVRRLQDLGLNPFWWATSLYFHTAVVTTAQLMGVDPTFSGDWVFNLYETGLLTYLSMKHGQPGANAFGPDPLAPKKKPHEIPLDPL